MTKLRNPLLSFGASGPLGKFLSFKRRLGQDIAETRPIVPDARSPNQLIWRHMYSKCTALWHLLSEAEQQEWETNARIRQMTGYAWFISQCLRPNPGIYLPLQGGTMQGDIDMGSHKISNLPAPVENNDAARKIDLGVGLASRVRAYRSGTAQSIPNDTLTTVALNAESFDNLNEFDTGTYTFTAKAAGGYFVDYCLLLTDLADGKMGLGQV
ncbi:unnamed protein product, partial [marine sediment metagenome]